jgi:hypothetical protein
VKRETTELLFGSSCRILQLAAADFCSSHHNAALIFAFVDMTTARAGQEQTFDPVDPLPNSLPLAGTSNSQRQKPALDGSSAVDCS